MHVLLATTHGQHLRNEGNAFCDNILTADNSWIHSFDHKLKQQNAEQHSQESPKKKNAWHSQML
jgi:hypothetical protein